LQPGVLAVKFRGMSRPRAATLVGLCLAALLNSACASSPDPARERGHSGNNPQAGHQGHSTAEHRFEDAEHWARVFEDPGRDEWQKPTDVLAALAIAKDARVADIGAATGYFPVRIARSHPDAVVYGVDIEPTLIEFLRVRAQRENLSNLHAVLAQPSDPKLPEPVDLVLLVDTYHHIEHRPTYFTNLASALRPRGRVAVIDFRKGSRIGPPEHHKLAEETVISEMLEAGYQVAERHDFLPHQYFLVFTRAR
jgi:SAM-dependent methyltransferase